MSKIYFAELPEDVQKRFRYGSAAPTGKAVTQGIDKAETAATQRIDKAESADHAAAFPLDPDKFAQRVAEKLDERESILQGKSTPGPAELMMIREFNFHKVFLAVIAIVATVLFAIVWRRFK
jgi:hypothetical protein